MGAACITVCRRPVWLPGEDTALSPGLERCWDRAKQPRLALSRAAPRQAEWAENRSRALIRMHFPDVLVACQVANSRIIKSDA